ncbi:MAG: InlB B-repeat-containing protein, partial [bacterium]
MYKRGVCLILFFFLLFLTGCSNSYRFSGSGEKYTLTIKTDGEGTTKPAESFEGDEGGQVSLQAKPDSGYKFVRWIGEVKYEYEKETDIIMDKDKEVTAVFTGKDDFDKGSGSEDDPYIVETAEQLNNVRKYLDSYFIQERDIDLKEYEEWNPIGYSGESLSDDVIDEQRKYYFSGHFDGNDKKITGLKISDEDKSYRGLFGRVYEATIENVSLEEVDITGENLSGSLAGLLDHSTVRNSHAKNGLVKADGVAGGLVGGMRKDSHIENSSTKVKVEGIDSIGGFVGYINQKKDDSPCTIKNSYARGDVEGFGFLEEERY